MRHLISVTLATCLCAGTGLAAEHVVTMAGVSYSPETLTAAVGDTIRFVNDDGTDHNVFIPTAAHALDTGKQEPGGEYLMSLGKAGAFTVECVFHAGMEMQVEVK